MLRWFVAFALTQLVEVPLWTVALQRRPRRGRAADALVAFGASALTHPIVWVGFPKLHLSYWLMIALAEAFAVVAEARYMRGFGLPRPYLTSLAVNGASVLVGLAVRALVGWP